MIKFASLIAISSFALSVMIFSLMGSVSADTFNHNKIIDDAVFDNANSQTASQINNWLNVSFGSASCISTDHGFSAPDPVGYSPTAGFTFGGAVSAGQVIYDAAQAYGINPQVLLTTLQKEQSLVSGSAGCDVLAYTAAAGYGCPDGGTTHNYPEEGALATPLYYINGNPVTSVSGTCVNSALKAGFSEQVIRAAWLLRFGEQRSEGNINWAIVKPGWDNSDDPQSCYGGPMTQGTWQRCPSGGSSYYDGYTTIDGVSTHMDNGATAALYWYTPHFAGNQSFSTIFVNWFGSPYSNCKYPPAVSNGIYRLYNGGTGNELLTTSQLEVCAATSLGWLYDGQILSTVAQGLPVYRLENNGRYLFTASASEKDSAISNYGYVLDGVAFNGDNPSQDPSNARPVYRLVSSAGTYLYTISSYERDDMLKYGYRYEGVAFYLNENPAGASVVPAYRLSNPNGSFLLTTSAGERDLAIQSYGYIYQGIGFNAITQLNPITVPIYRLAGSGGYLFTTSLFERNNAVKIGYRDEGISMFTYGTMNDPGLNNVYRLSRTGSYFYTTSSTERDSAVQNYGFKLEGIGFQTP